MRKLSVLMMLAVFAGAILMAGVVFDSALALAGPKTKLVVDDDLVDCPDAGYTTIQDAVDAAPVGAEIKVCPGTYDEQVTIDKPLKIKGENGAVVMPSGMTANTTSLSSGNPIAAAILVMDTTKVSIENLTVDGANNGISSCSPTLIGIYYRNASGKIKKVAVRNMKLGAGLGGCQSGLGIFVQSGDGGTSKVAVEYSSVHDYQKNGITGNEPGTDIMVKGNVVTGIGPTTGAAQNGIQIGFGATGRIEKNTVVNHIWSGVPWVATNLLIYYGDDVKIAKNTIGKSQMGMYLIYMDNSKIEGNNVFDTDAWDGILLWECDNNKVENNTVTNSDEAAVFLQGNNNKITGNRFNEAPIGVWKFGGVGNVIEGNHYVNTPIPYQDPPPPPAPEGTAIPFN